MAKKKKKDIKIDLHDDLKKVDLDINEFGQVVGESSIDSIIDFLNKNLEDKKLEKEEE